MLLAYTDAVRRLDNAKHRQLLARDRRRIERGDLNPSLIRIVFYAMTLLEAGIIRLLGASHPTREMLSDLADELYPDWTRVINVGKRELFETLATSCYINTKNENRANAEGYPGLVVATGLVLRRLNLDLWSLRPELARFCENRALLEKLGIW